MRFRPGSVLVFSALLLAAIGFAFLLASQTRDWREQRRLTLEIEAYGGSHVSFDADNNVTWISVQDRILSSQIARFDTLEHLDLSHSNITDDDLWHLRNLPGVMCLHLSHTSITNAGLEHLAGVRITLLRLGDTQISDDGMDALAEIKIDKGVDLSGTEVTQEGVEYLKSKCPNLYVIHRNLEAPEDVDPNGSREEAAD